MKKKSLKKDNEIMQILTKKAWKSSGFIDQLINNPAVVIERETGIKLNIAEGTKIVIEDQTDSDTIYLNVPRRIELDDYELSEEELETVSGGSWVTALAVISGIAALDYIIEEAVDGWNDYNP